MRAPAVERQIGAFMYRMRPVGASTGRACVLRLMRPMAAVVGGLQVLRGGKVSLEDLDIERAFAAISDADLEFVFQSFLSQVEVRTENGAWAPIPDPDDHFAQRYEEQLSLMRWGVDLNRFFGSALERLAKALEEKAKEESISPTASTPG